MKSTATILLILFSHPNRANCPRPPAPSLPNENDPAHRCAFHETKRCLVHNQDSSIAFEFAEMVLHSSSVGITQSGKGRQSGRG